MDKDKLKILFDQVSDKVIGKDNLSEVTHQPITIEDGMWNRLREKQRRALRKLRKEWLG